jgi:excisionase family DNA binding protein
MADILTRDRLLKPAEAAEYLGLAVASIYCMASRRRLPSIKVGRSLRFRRVDLERVVKAGMRPAIRPLHTLEDPRDGEGGRP